MFNFKYRFVTSRFSISILILPYIIYNWINLINSPFYKGLYIINLIIILFILEIISFLLHKTTNDKKIFNFIFLFILIFFYGFYITNTIHDFFANSMGIDIRGRFLYFILILFSFILIFKIKLKFYKYLNIFFILFSLINLLFLKNHISNNDITLKNNYKKINNHFVVKKPIILIISDMYSSPEELNRIFEDSSSIYSFSNKLKSNKWIIKNNFKSYESETIRSLSSLLNFNLSINNNLHLISTDELSNKYLVNSLIYDSLMFKKINIINFGIFDIGKSKPLNQLYNYHKNIYDVFFQNTSFYQIKFNTLNFNKRGFSNNFYPTEFHNKYIIENLADSLASLSNSNTFIYVHLWMPHSPYIFSPNYKLKKSNISNYKTFWDFTNLKMDTLLSSLTKSNKYRIIFTGDHGFRDDIRINPFKTFAAFYGFDKKILNDVKSVQDIGSLINSSF